jgi:hypothetical protein
MKVAPEKHVYMLTVTDKKTISLIAGTAFEIIFTLLTFIYNDLKTPFRCKFLPEYICLPVGIKSYIETIVLNKKLTMKTVNQKYTETQFSFIGNQIPNYFVITSNIINVKTFTLIMLDNSIFGLINEGDDQSHVIIPITIIARFGDILLSDDCIVRSIYHNNTCKVDHGCL